MARGTYWSMAGAIASRGFQLMAAMLVARILGREGFGEFGIIQGTVMMFAVFAGFGMGLTATRHVAQFRHTDPARTGRILALANVVTVLTGATVALVLTGLSPWLASATLNAPHLAGCLRIAAALLFLQALLGVQTGALSGFEAFRDIARASAISGAVSLPMLTWGAWIGGLPGALWGLTLSALLNLFLNHIALERQVQEECIAIDYAGLCQEWPLLRDFSIPAVMAGVMVGPVNWMCQAIIVNSPDGYAEMGVYTAANQWFMALTYLPGLVGQVAFPVLSESAVDQGSPALKRLLIRLVVGSAVLTLPLLTVGSLVSPFLMGFYGPAFRDAWPVLVAVLGSAAVVALLMPVCQMIAATGRMWIGFWMNFGWGITFLFLTYLLADSGAWGIALARLAAYVAHFVWASSYAYCQLNRKRAEIVPVSVL
jgi:O-antigen/teichoic acid export membrane protein